VLCKKNTHIERERIKHGKCYLTHGSFVPPFIAQHNNIGTSQINADATSSQRAKQHTRSNHSTTIVNIKSTENKTLIIPLFGVKLVQCRGASGARQSTVETSDAQRRHRAADGVVEKVEKRCPLAKQYYLLAYFQRL
jgi:hypothetical protein